MWNEVGMARNEKGLKQAIADIQALREEFYADVRVLGSANGMNPELERRAVWLTLSSLVS